MSIRVAIGVFGSTGPKISDNTSPNWKSGRNYRRKIITLIRMEPPNTTKTARFRCLNFFALSLCLGVLFSPAARAVEWEFKPPQVGLALAVQNPNGTNWMVQRRLGTVPGGVEFTFPLQLCYSSVRTERGLFADN